MLSSRASILSIQSYGSLEEDDEAFALDMAKNPRRRKSKNRVRFEEGGPSSDNHRDENPPVAVLGLDNAHAERYADEDIEGDSDRSKGETKMAFGVGVAKMPKRNVSNTDDDTSGVSTAFNNPNLEPCVFVNEAFEPDSESEVVTEVECNDADHYISMGDAATYDVADPTASTDSEVPGIYEDFEFKDDLSVGGMKARNKTSQRDNVESVLSVSTTMLPYCHQQPYAMSSTDQENHYSEVYVGERERARVQTHNEEQHGQSVHFENPVCHSLTVVVKAQHKARVFRVISITKEGILCKLAYVFAEVEKWKHQDGPNRFLGTLLNKVLTSEDGGRHRRKGSALKYREVDGKRLLFVAGSRKERARSQSLTSLGAEKEHKSRRSTSMENMHVSASKLAKEASVSSTPSYSVAKKRRSSLSTVHVSVDDSKIENIRRSRSLPELPSIEASVNDGGKGDDVSTEVKRVELPLLHYKRMIHQVQQNIACRVHTFNITI